MSNETRSYINRKTGELFSANEDLLPMTDDMDEDDDLSDSPEWEREMVDKMREVEESDDWVKLPSGFDLDQYGIMHRFSNTVADETLSADLHGAIGGKGTFGRFKDMCHRHGILDDYHRFREADLGRIAADFLETHGIEYRREPS